MKLRCRPEDFKVEELARWEDSPRGDHRVYRITKSGVTTLDAVRAIAHAAGVRPGLVAFGGLKDRHGVTIQHVSLPAECPRNPCRGVRAEPAGRTDEPFSSALVQGNRFTILVRHLAETDAREATASAEEVRVEGVLNYFDSQRFGALRHGQGFIARFLVDGDPRGAIRAHMAVPSTHDRSDDREVRAEIARRWGDWAALSRRFGRTRYGGVLSHLSNRPRDFAGAILRIDPAIRGLYVFAYQSYVWNRAASLLAHALFPSDRLFDVPYEAGRLTFFRRVGADEARRLAAIVLPLPDHRTSPADPRAADALRGALAEEGLTIDRFKIDAPRGVFFREEARDLIVIPRDLRIDPPEPDDLHPKRLRQRLIFTLPRGAYATIILKRLYGR